jgi:acetylornithine deacetylase/succinyl-diaminopimelate desuccinylase-like protein
VPTAVETLPASKNVIPDRARITIDWRILPGLRPADALAQVESFLRPRVALPEGFALEVRFAFEHQQTYTGVEQDRKLFTHGFLMEPDQVIVKAAVAAVGEATGRTPTLRPWTFATDGGQTCGAAGIPTIGYAPGEERFAHTNRERLELRSARTVYCSYPALVRAVQEAVSADD